MDLKEQKNKSLHEDVDRIYKGKKLLPDLDHAILANLRGSMMGSYPTPLTERAKILGYYPIQEATEKELKKIQQIKASLRK